eukprot:Skav224250  [mRNA]  locus=scaffold939:1551211:1563644:- [translate_table: standard]
MELSKEQSEQIVTDLAQYIVEQGGTIGSERLQPFYAKYPSHRALVKNMRSFCEQHPDRILITAGEGPHYSLKVSVWKDEDVLGLLRSFMEKCGGAVALSDLADFSFRQPQCSKAILAGGRAFRMLLPSRLSNEISTEVLRGLQSSAHRLVYRTDGAMKAGPAVALRSGWLDQTQLPSTVLSHKDLDEVARRPRCALGHLCGHVWVQQFVSYLPGLWCKAENLLYGGSTIFMGPAGSGKTTILRNVAVQMSRHLQVLVVDFSGHLADISSSDLQYLATSDAKASKKIREAIDEHVPEVIVAEFSDTYSALKAGRVCDEAGVRLACSVRSNLHFLIESFVHAYTGPQRSRDLACLTFPFKSAVQLSRQTEEWEVYRDAPAAVCSMGRSRLPRCEMHQSAASPPENVEEIPSETSKSQAFGVPEEGHSGPGEDSSISGILGESELSPAVDLSPAGFSRKHGSGHADEEVWSGIDQTKYPEKFHRAASNLCSWTML